MSPQVKSRPTQSWLDAMRPVFPRLPLLVASGLAMHRRCHVSTGQSVFRLACLA